MITPGHCVLCDAPLTSAALVAERDRNGRPSPRVRCAPCGLVQVHPRPSAKEVATYYDGEYWRTEPVATLHLHHPNGTVEVVPPDDRRYEDALALQARNRAAAVIAELGLPHGARVLEIGCGDGRTLAEIESCGMNVVGWEPDPDKARAASSRIRYGRVVPLGLYDASALARGFDAVISFHVVEHLHDPVAGLARMRSLLTDDGRIWLEVPNLDAAIQPAEERFYLAPHLVDFTRHTLRKALERAGFDRIAIRATPGGLQAHGTPQRRASATMSEALASPLDRLVRAEPEALLSLDELRELRRQFLDYISHVRRMADAYSSAADAIGKLGDVLVADGGQRLESWHEDPYVHGFEMGKGHAQQRAGFACHHIANAMRILESSDEQRAET